MGLQIRSGSISDSYALWKNPAETGKKLDKALLYKIPPQGWIGFSLDLIMEKYEK